MTRCGAVVDRQNDFHRTALHLTVQGKQVAILSLLIQAGVNVNPAPKIFSSSTRETDWHLIHEAISTRNTPIVKMLLEAGTLLDPPLWEETDTRTSLDIAVKRRDRWMVKLLPAHGAAITPDTLHWARGSINRRNNKTILPMLEKALATR